MPLAALVLIVLAAWAYLILAPMPGATSGMSDMAGMQMAAAPWSWREGLLLFLMWAVMMVAMMLPAAAPMLLLFSRMGSARSAGGGALMPFFAGGYLLVWSAFSAVAAAVQWGLHSLAILSPEMRTVNPAVGAAILIAAGIYQWLPLKHSCLTRCRSPLGFLTTSWRDGRAGALRMGLEHGAFCVGCCWMLMALLFVAGVMNLWWVAALSALVLLEKTFPNGVLIARIGGVALIAAGIALIA